MSGHGFKILLTGVGMAVFGSLSAQAQYVPCFQKSEIIRPVFPTAQFNRPLFDVPENPRPVNPKPLTDFPDIIKPEFVGADFIKPQYEDCRKERWTFSGYTMARDYPKETAGKGLKAKDAPVVAVADKPVVEPKLVAPAVPKAVTNPGFFFAPPKPAEGCCGQAAPVKTEDPAASAPVKDKVP